MPDGEQTTQDDPDVSDLADGACAGGVFSRYGIASTLLGLLCVAAVVLVAVIWWRHHTEAAERSYQTNAMQAAADWTGVLINLNSGNVDSSLARLHDSTVGQLNADFEASLEPYRDVVQTLQSQTTGRIEAVAIEKIHHDLDTAPGAPAAQSDAGSTARNGHAHRHGDGGRDVGESERRRPTADRAVESAPRRLRSRRPAAHLAARVHAMRNVLRVVAFDVVGPLAAIGALLSIGVFLGWPLWWVAVASMLCLLVVQAMLINFYLMRRDRVTLGTDDDGPALRLALVGLVTAILVAALVVGYTRWTLPDRQLRSDADEVVRLATGVSEATATFSPQDPASSIDRAASMMAPEQAAAFRENFGKSTQDLARKNISAHAQTISAGVEALGPAAASVAVVMRGIQSAPGQQPSRAVMALRVTLAKPDDRWLVYDVAPINGA